MAASPRNIACFALLVSVIALQVPSCVDDDQRGATMAAGTASASARQPPPSFDGALKAILPLAGMEAQLLAAAIIYGHHLHHAAAVGNWRILEVVVFVSCLQVGFLQFFLFVRQPGAGGAGAAPAQARALGVTAAAAHALPGFAAVTFFLGIILVYVHVGNGGGGGVAGNGNGQVAAAAPAGVGLVSNMTLGAALACLTSIILAFWINTK